MPKGKSSNPKVRTRPALTPEAMENQLIYKAYKLANQQFDDGTASSQVMTHFLKLGTEAARLEREKLRYESKLLEAKAMAIETSRQNEGLYSEVLKAMTDYKGLGQDADDDIEEGEYFDD